MKKTGNRILVTGGAGFIGSHIVDALLEREDVAEVRVLDNLFSGSLINIQSYLHNPKFTFIEGDIRNLDTCLNACKDVDAISHQAAIGSVPRSVKDPITTHAVNVDGTLNIFEAARQCDVKRIVYASSSSVYGDSIELPKKEEKIGLPLSPYALTKLISEQYAQVFNRLYDIDFIGLRYFNVFGPRQSPEGPYAAVIPLFIEAALKANAPVIFGDGTQSRDFTYVGNVVDANMLALYSQKEEAVNQVYNVAVGNCVTLTELYALIKEMTGSKADVVMHSERTGDIKHSLADVSKIKKLLEYSPKEDLKEGLAKAIRFYIEKNG